MVQRFSDFAVEDKPLVGDKIKMVDVLNQLITVDGYRQEQSKYTKDLYTILQIHFQNKPRVLFTGSKVLAKQVQKYADRIPFETVITKNEKYYTFT